MDADILLNQLRDLEVALHQPHIRSDIHRLDELLHESFTEFGRSGRHYHKDDILRELPIEQLSGSIWSQDFVVAVIADGVALLTYKSARLDDKDELSRHTLRSSLWQLTSHGWQMRFHQGTPADPFAKNAF